MKRALEAFALLLAFVVGSGVAPLGAEPPPLSIYGRLPGFERARISPSGDRIAIVGTFQDQRQLLVIDKDSKPILSLTLGDVKVRGLDWAGDDQIIVYKSDTVGLDMDFVAEKAELFSTIVVPVNSSRPIWTVFQNSKMITGGVAGLYGIRQRNGKWFGYFGGITLEDAGKAVAYLSNTEPMLYEVDLDTKAVRKVADRTGNGLFRGWTMDQDGHIAATVDYSPQSNKWSIRNTKGQNIAIGESKLGGIDLVGLGASGGTLVYRITDDDTNNTRWFEVPINGGEAKEILPDVEIDRGLLDHRDDRLIGYATGPESPAYHFLDAHQQKVAAAAVKAFPGRIVTLVDWNDAFDKLIVTTEGADDSGTWWLVDIKTGSANAIGRSYLVPEAEVGPIKMIRYKAADGTDIDAVLTLPPGRDAKKLPVVIFPHGGPADHDALEFNWWAQAFAAQGYAVLQPNFRGSTGYGAAFERAGDGEWGRKMQTDLSDGLAYLAHEGIVDPDRACIMGASYGGYAALAGVTLQQGVYRCAVAVAGVSDVAKMAYTDRTESGDDPALSRGLKKELGSGRNLAMISPIRFVDKVTVPILLVHGKDDTRVHYEQSSTIAAALRRAGKTVDLVTLPGEDHWLSKGTTRLAMLQAAVTFVEKNNPPDRPMKSATAVSDAAARK